MASSPTTPPADFSSDLQSWRFKDTGAPCEWAEEYRPGGFHPVNLGDTFHEDKYKVIRKLGDGSYSTVWLAVSTGIPRYVALKIMIAKSSTNPELSILDHLSNLATDPRSQHVTTLLDFFYHRGPNGKHQCLVFEPMGATAASLVEELPENQPKMYGKPQRYPKWMAKKILTHTLHGLAFLHQNGVGHGDVQPGNLLFSIKNIEAVEEDSLKQDETKTRIPLERIDGMVDRWAPKYLYLNQPLYDWAELDPNLLRVQLSDLGSAFWSGDPPNETVTPIALRAPEQILRHSFSTAIDIWSFGCLMFEFLTGRALFAVGIFGNDQKDKDDADDDHLIQLNDVIRPLPDSIMAAWLRASKWYTPNRQRLQPYSSEEPYIHQPLQALFLENKPAEIDEKECEILCSLMLRILEYDPVKRPLAVDILKHPWFSE